MIFEGCKFLPVLNVKTRELWSVMPYNVVSIGTTITDDILHSEERETGFFKMLVKFNRHIRARQWVDSLQISW